jgi:hypothetical protein
VDRGQGRGIEYSLFGFPCGAKGGTKKKFYKKDQFFFLEKP